MAIVIIAAANFGVAVRGGAEGMHIMTGFGAMVIMGIAIVVVVGFIIAVGAGLTVFEVGASAKEECEDETTEDDDDFTEHMGPPPE
jgi:hypothetical protein